MWTTKRLGALVIACQLVTSAAHAATLQKIHALDGGPLHWFGEAVATDGNLALIGAPLYTIDFYAEGSAYLFDANTGQQLRQLFPNPPFYSSDLFGYDVELKGDIALIGAPGNDPTNTGAVYVYRASTGQQLHKFIPADLTADRFANDLFGHSVALHGTTALAGAPSLNTATNGSAYLFDPLAGTTLRRFVASDRRREDHFGQSVALSDKYALIGAPGATQGTLKAGAAYLFDLATGQELKKFVRHDPVLDDEFGRFVAITGNYAVISTSHRLRSDRDAAYVYDIPTGQFLYKLTPMSGNMPATDAYGFGSGLAVHGPLAAVGAYGDANDGKDTGAVYLFDLATGMQLQKITPLDDRLDYFGYGVAFSSTHLVAGAYRDNDLGDESGSAYIVSPVVPEPPASLLALSGALILSHTRRARS